MRMYDACVNGDVEFVRSMIKNHDVTAYNNGLYGACQSANMEIVKLMISCGANDLNRGLRVASCQNKNANQKELVELLIQKGANDYNHVLYCASKNGNIKLAQLMIEKGANNYNQSLDVAYRKNGNTEMIKLMIENGANANQIQIKNWYSFPRDEDDIKILLCCALSLKVFEKINGYNQLLKIIKEREEYIIHVMNNYIDRNINNFLLKQYILNDF